MGAALSEKKVAWQDRWLGEHADDAVLVPAYRAKRAEERSAATALFSVAAMAAAYARAEAVVVPPEARLVARDGARLYGDALIMAHLFWKVELLRMENTEVAQFWEGGRLLQVEHLTSPPRRR